MNRDLAVRPTYRWTLIVLAGLVGAVGVGGLAAWAQSDHRLLSFVVFAAMTAPIAGCAAWLLLRRPGPDEPADLQDSVEEDWSRRAGYGAFIDLVVILGLATAAEAILEGTRIPLVAFVVLALGDLTVRYLVLSRRES